MRGARRQAVGLGHPAAPLAGLLGPRRHAAPLAAALASLQLAALLAVLFTPLAFAGEASAQQRAAEVPFVATPLEVVQRMLELARVTSDDVVYDLGSGDGRIPIAAAARHGARGVGIEINPDLVREARQKADSAGVVRRVEFREQDLFEADLREATVVTLFLGPELNQRLIPTFLAQLRPGTRLVSYFFEMGDWPPDTSLVFEWGEARSDAPLFLWVVPARVAGTWRLEMQGGTGAAYMVRFRQKYQRVEGQAVPASLDGRAEAGAGGGDEQPEDEGTTAGAGAGPATRALTDVDLAGDRIAFSLEDTAGGPPLRFTGRVGDDTLEGTVTAGRSSRGRWKATLVSRSEVPPP